MLPPDNSSSALQAHLKRLWIHGFLAGVGLLFIVLLICYFIWGWPFTTTEIVEEVKQVPPQARIAPTTPPAPALKTAPPPAGGTSPPANLEAELSSVLAKLGQADQNKNLHQLLDLYSPSFPNLPQKTQEISRSWASFDYLSLNFKLSDVKAAAPDRATAKVTWKIKTRQRQTQEIKEITRVYLVSFILESGQWHIRSLEKAGNRDKSS